MLIKISSSFCSKAFKILGVNQECTIEDIKRAYYKQAQIYHPDKNNNPNAKQTFSQICDAYNSLLSKFNNKSNKGHEEKHQKQPQQKSNKRKERNRKEQDQEYIEFQFVFYEGKRRKMSKNFQELYKEFEQQTKQKIKKQRSKRDIYYRLYLNPEQLKNGCTKQIKFNIRTDCVCRQSKNKQPCKSCNGQGSKKSFIMGKASMIELCQKCDGSGIHQTNCKVCKEKGYKDFNKFQRIIIPKNSQNHSTIKFVGKGNKYKNKAGDLFVKLYNRLKTDQKNHQNKQAEEDKTQEEEPIAKQQKQFQSKGEDIYTEEKISIVQAVLGTQLNIKTVYGTIKLDIPKGSQHDQIFVMKGYGHQTETKNKFGNHYVKVKIEIPSTLSQRQQELYKQLLTLQKGRIRFN